MVDDAVPADTDAAQQQLAALLEDGSDVQLVFAEDAVVPAHSLYLRQWSKVLANALDASSSSNSSKRIPMEGTSKEDWLLAMEFVYPVMPVPDVTWDNLAVLLKVGNKYDVPTLLARAGSFLKANATRLTSDHTSPTFAWKWIKEADAAGLTAVAEACIDAKITDQNLLSQCTKEQLVGLSPTTL